MFPTFLENLCLAILNEDEFTMKHNNTSDLWFAARIWPPLCIVYCQLSVPYRLHHSLSFVFWARSFDSGRLKVTYFLPNNMFSELASAHLSLTDLHGLLNSIPASFQAVRTSIFPQCRSRTSQMVSLEFFIDIILPIALWPWDRLSL